MPPEDAIVLAKPVTLDQVIGHISWALPRLSTGDRARLRHGPLEAGDAGAPAFWKLAAHEKYGFKVDDKWAAIVQAMAILTPRPADGDDNPKGPHNPSIKFGQALCDGGDAGWLEQQPEVKRTDRDPRPVLSELRLAKMLAAKGELRRELVIRAAKIIAKSRTPVDCAGVARFILDEHSDESARQIAKHYYARLARAGNSAIANGGDDEK